MLGGLDGMTYKGVVGNGVDREDYMPRTGTDPIESNTAEAMALGVKVGDMFIAKGTEGSDGSITSQTLEWTYIPAGNDSLSDVTYSAIVNTTSPENSLTLQNGSHTTIAKIDLREGSDIAISSVASGTNNNTLTATINHGTITTTDNTVVTSTQLPTDQTAENTEGGASFAAITGLTISNGHVTNIQRGKFIPVTYNLDSPVVGQTANTNDATISIRLKDSNNTYKTPSIVKLTSNTITFTPNANNADTLNMDFEWGTF